MMAIIVMFYNDDEILASWHLPPPPPRTAHSNLAWPPVQVTPLYWTMGTLLDEAMTADGSYSDDEIYACGTLLQVRPSASLCRWRRPAAPSALISVLSNALSCLVIGGLAAQPHT